MYLTLLSKYRYIVTSSITKKHTPIFIKDEVSMTSFRLTRMVMIIERVCKKTSKRQVYLLCTRSRVLLGVQLGKSHIAQRCSLALLGTTEPGIMPMRSYLRTVFAGVTEYNIFCALYGRERMYYLWIFLLI